MSEYKKVAFTVYPVTDMIKSRDFYEKSLGFKPGDNFDNHWQEYDLGGTTFAISTSISEWVKPGTQGGVSFEVNDIQKIVKTLKDRKVNFAMDEIMDTPVCHMAFIKDPDGNSIGLHQAKE